MNGILTWLKENKLLVAAVSVAGSLAGLGFAAVDLRDELKKKKLIK